ncbi:APH(3') family aminoglycoside O-phosphotransferase [Paenibacillus ferrarius]|uniref:APH(3') family aminoglycoside O-phosphotransferase n=1 Tax=Paenibacillus ferrarius TaxID=1469647 RepID=UPI003D2C1267
MTQNAHSVPAIPLPAPLESLLAGCAWRRETIGHSASQTYQVCGAAGRYFLKIQSLQAVESLVEEKERLLWLKGRLPVPEVVYYGRDEAQEFLLVTELPGVHASDDMWKDQLPELLRALARGLKQIHQVPMDDCPFDQRLAVKMEEAMLRVRQGLVDEEDFDESRLGLRAEEVLEQMLSSVPAEEDLVFTHGDYCMPNIIMLSEGAYSGFIDVGRAGIADRYQDLALAIRSIRYNFGDPHVQTFVEAYGLDKLDEAKVSFYQLMDEFF